MVDFCAKVIYGSVSIEQFHKFEDGRMVNYSYSITYDRDGIETSRTEPTKGPSIGWDDGTPFTPQDLKELQNNES